MSNERPSDCSSWPVSRDPSAREASLRWGWGVIPSVRHQAAIPAGRRQKGFAKALRSATGVSLGTDCRFVPDAFDVEEHKRIIRIWEVEATHPIGDKKIEKLRLLAGLLDALGWKLRVVWVPACDRGRPRRFDLETGQPHISTRALHAAVALLDKR